QEQPADRQDQIASGELVAEDREEGGGQAAQPGQGKQQQDARAHRQQQAGAPRRQLLRRGQLSRQDRDEDDVVDAEDDLEKGERRQRDQGFRRQPFSHSWSAPQYLEPELGEPADLVVFHLEPAAAAGNGSRVDGRLVRRP